MPLYLAALGLAGCRDHKSAATADLRGAAGDCNLLLITLDTTRADRLGCYGRPQAATPALDGLAQAGVRFTQAFTQVPVTLPAHTVLLTGTYPPENGVRNNSRYALRTDLPTLAEIFRQHGYQTGAFIGSQILDRRYGLDRGFEVYEDRMPLYDRPANQVCDDALAWLSRVRDRPFFAWVHFYDPHTPYVPPPDFLRRTGEAYQGEIAFMDFHIGRLLDWLRSHDLSSKTLVIAVADHGESLGEHGFLWHSLLLYDSIMRVPLIVSLPGRLPQAASRDAVVGLVDILPTILDLMGWSIPAEVSGQSFLAALAGQATPPRQSYGETDYGYEDYGWAKLRCLIEQRWKYIRAPEIELYDLVADPGELHNLAAEYPEEVARLEADLAACEQAMTRRESVAVKLDTQAIQVLRSLGYAGGPTPTSLATERLKNPKDMVEVCHKHREAEALLGAGRPMEALELIEPAATRSPESFVLVELLGKTYAALELFDLAQLALQDALAIQPKSADTWLALAQVLQSRRAFGRAIRACQQALAVDPAHSLAPALATELSQAGRRQTARLAELRQQLETTPGRAELRLDLVGELLAAKQTAEAIRVLQDGLARDPGSADLAARLAWILATTPDDQLRNGGEALRWAQVACGDKSGASPSALDGLAAAQAETGDFEAALQTAERALQLAKESGNRRLTIMIARHLTHYRAKTPWRAPE